MPAGIPLIRIEGMPMVKLWWRSRTLWFNLICLMLAAAEQQLNVLQGHLPGGLYAWLAFVLPVGNAALRFVTQSGIALKSSDTPANSQAGFGTIETLVLLAVLAAFIAGFGLGKRIEHASQLSLNAKQAQANAKAGQQDRQAADTATVAAQRNAGATRDNAVQLQEELHRDQRQPLVVSAACPARTVGAARAGVPAPAHGERAAAAPASSPADQPQPAQAAAAPQLADDAGAQLTLGGVRLWNSALAGEHLPAGACGPDDPESAACAAAGGITFEQLWANHIENATRCRVDRDNYEQLRGFLRLRNLAQPEVTQ